MLASIYDITTPQRSLLAWNSKSIDVFVDGRTLLSAGLLDLRRKSNTDQSVVWLELLQGFRRIVHEGEAGCLATTELSLETEDVDLVLVGLVHLGELATEFILRDVGTVGVEDVTVEKKPSQNPCSM